MCKMKNPSIPSISSSRVIQHPVSPDSKMDIGALLAHTRTNQADKYLTKLQKERERNANRYHKSLEELPVRINKVLHVDRRLHQHSTKRIKRVQPVKDKIPRKENSENLEQLLKSTAVGKPCEDVQTPNGTTSTPSIEKQNLLRHGNTNVEKYDPKTRFNTKVENTPSWCGSQRILNCPSCGKFNDKADNPEKMNFHNSHCISGNSCTCAQFCNFETVYPKPSVTQGNEHCVVGRESSYSSVNYRKVIEWNSHVQLIQSQNNVAPNKKDKRFTLPPVHRGIFNDQNENNHSETCFIMTVQKYNKPQSLWSSQNSLVTTKTFSADKTLPVAPTVLRKKLESRESSFCCSSSYKSSASSYKRSAKSYSSQETYTPKISVTITQKRIDHPQYSDRTSNSRNSTASSMSSSSELPSERETIKVEIKRHPPTKKMIGIFKEKPLVDRRTVDVE